MNNIPIKRQITNKNKEIGKKWTKDMEKESSRAEGNKINSDEIGCKVCVPRYDIGCEDIYYEDQPDEAKLGKEQNAYLLNDMYGNEENEKDGESSIIVLEKTS